MPLFLARLLLKKLLTNPDLKTKLFAALEAEAKKTDTVLDDEAVQAFKAVWDVVIPVIVGQIPS